MGPPAKAANQPFSASSSRSSVSSVTLSGEKLTSPRRGMYRIIARPMSADMASWAASLASALGAKTLRIDRKSVV